MFFLYHADAHLESRQVVSMLLPPDVISNYFFSTGTSRITSAFSFCEAEVDASFNRRHSFGSAWEKKKKTNDWVQNGPANISIITRRHGNDDISFGTLRRKEGHSRSVTGWDSSQWQRACRQWRKESRWLKKMA